MRALGGQAVLHVHNNMHMCMCMCMLAPPPRGCAEQNPGPQRLSLSRMRAQGGAPQRVALTAPCGEWESGDRGAHKSRERAVVGSAAYYEMPTLTRPRQELCGMRLFELLGLVLSEAILRNETRSQLAGDAPLVAADTKVSRRVVNNIQKTL